MSQSGGMPEEGERERQVNAFVAFDRRAICIGSAQIVPRSINIGMSRMTSRARCALNKLIIIIIKFSREVLLFEKWQGNLVGLNREERGKGRSNGDRSSLQIINFLDRFSIFYLFRSRKRSFFEIELLRRL